MPQQLAINLYRKHRSNNNRINNTGSSSAAVSIPNQVMESDSADLPPRYDEVVEMTAVGQSAAATDSELTVDLGDASTITIKNEKADPDYGKFSYIQLSRYLLFS